MNGQLVLDGGPTILFPSILQFYGTIGCRWLQAEGVLSIL